MKYSSGNKKAGFGLIEILIVLAIIATTMLAATQISLNGIRAIKLDEVVDFANGMLLQGLELAKSPSTVRVFTLSGASNLNGSYRLQTASNGTTELRMVTTTQTPLTLAQCTSSSAYFVNITGATGVTNPQVCLQLMITARTNLGVNYYEIRTRLVYNLGGQTLEREIYAYRRGAFQQITI